MSWNAVSGGNITYTVCYSRKLSTQPVRWSFGNCGTSGITGTSTTLGPLSGGTTYYIWVRAVSSGGQGPDSNLVQQNACNGKLHLLYQGRIGSRAVMVLALPLFFKTLLLPPIHMS